MKRIQTWSICALAVAAVIWTGFSTRYSESQAQTQATSSVALDIETLKESIDNFFENMSDPTKGANKAVEDFLKDSSLLGNEKTKTKFAEGLKTINSNFGPYVSYEPIGSKMIGSDLVVFRYLYKCQDYPVVWYFTYYRPRAKGTPDSASSSAFWTLIGFRYDTNLDAALLDATFDMRN